MIHAGAQLARRLEALICTEWRQLAGIAQSLWPAKDPTYLDVAGGVALWLGEGGLVNVATGLAMEAPIGDAELRQVEDFYARRGAAPMLATCPFADPTLFAVLAKRGWQVAEFENVLALELEEPAGAAHPGAASPAPVPSPPAAPAPAPGVEVRTCSEAERALWGRLAARGFSDEAEPGPGNREFGGLMAAHTAYTLVLAWADGRPAGTGALKIEGDLAWLSGDTTMPEFRGRGVQQAVQRYRLRLAREAGCALAVTEAAPGSGSQRNMERLGFRVVYPHLQFAKI
jgi:GNAT superfamily N-acetyltransferase